MKEFDKDYDVFYPWVQNHIVNGTETFREVLSKYDEAGMLSDIEEELPLLTILVPDWSWVTDFSACSWDTESQDISVVYRSGTISGKVGNSSASGSIKLGYGTTSKNESTITVTTKTKDESDDLGTALLYYTDPIILSSDSLDGVSGYRVKEIGTGFVYMLVLPKYE